jgi:tetratricopeptide (TPR) repeat protein
MGEIVRGILLCLALTLAAVPARAQTVDETWERCKSNDPDLAIAGCTAMMRVGPQDKLSLSGYHVMRGYAYEHKGLTDMALADFDNAISLAPDSPQGYSSRGGFNYRRGLYDKAIPDLTKTIALEPDFATAYKVRGFAYELKGLNKQAIADYRAALKLTPNDDDLKQGLKRLGVTP